MCGLSGSGKSTISKKIAEKHNAIILSTDGIREEIHGNSECQDNPEKIFGILRYRIRKNLDNNRNIIVDATNLKKTGVLSFIMHQIMKRHLFVM